MVNKNRIAVFYYEKYLNVNGKAPQKLDIRYKKLYTISCTFYAIQLQHAGISTLKWLISNIQTET